ncbi:MAG: hypothetical protein GQ564_02980 [Bacteroidales bacterium]|nr:hypothetical protein [Bacteroidales bacterium]
MEKKNIINSKKENSEYNYYLKPLIDEIFQQKVVGVEGYLMSSESNFNEDRHINGVIDESNKAKHEFVKKVKTENVINRFDTLGLNEQGLSVYLLMKTYDLVVLTGAMGSGKTATSRFVLDFFKKNHRCKDLECNCSIKENSIISLNFNEGFNLRDPDKVFIKFNDKFYKKLLRKVKPILKKDSNIFLRFIDRICDRSFDEDGESEFEEFVSIIEDDIGEWNKWLFSKKINAFFKWLENHDDIDVKIELLGYIIRYIRKNIYKRKECFILFFDNIDQLPEIAQNMIISSIFRFTEISKVVTLLNVRLTSFGWVPAKASFSWVHYQHAGADPLEIILRRIDYFLNNQSHSNYELIKSSIPNHLYELFIIRLNYIKHLIVEKERLRKCMIAIGGNSVRRSLFLATRIFYNYVVSIDSKEPYENDIIRALLLNASESHDFKQDDRLICNIYLNNKNGGFSIMKLRILQFLHYNKINNKRTTLQSLLDHLKWFYQKLQNSELLFCINDLLNDRRRLIYLDGIGYFENINKLYTCPNENINITFSGIKYYKELSCDLVYIQESFESIDWDNGYSMPNYVDHSVFSDRVYITRLGMRHLFTEDKKQTKFFLKHSNLSNFRMNQFLSTEIIYNCARSFFLISLGQIKTDQLRSEINNWVSLLLDVYNSEISTFGIENMNYYKLIDDISDYYNVKLN